MDLRIRIPCKSFILGEYAVLDGGLCLGAATTPHFEFFFRTKNESVQNLSLFHESSPAGKFLKSNFELFKNLEIKFSDPLLGQGGFGASTAQYLGLWAYRECIVNSQSRSKLLEPERIKSMISEYRDFAAGSEGRAPSGADLVIQLAGGFNWIDSKTWDIQKTKWPWPNLIGYLIATGNKLSTHTHLQDLNDFNSNELFHILQQARSSIKTMNLDHWIKSVNNYSNELEQLGLASPATLAIVREIRSWSGVLAAKGCGALGADVIFCVLTSDEEKSVQSQLLSKNLKIVATTETFSSGLEILPYETSINRELIRD
ncbi:MAG: hypothetical protein AABY64_02970 [Bdellovibrionota bacterium]